MCGHLRRHKFVSPMCTVLVGASQTAHVVTTARIPRSHLAQKHSHKILEAVPGIAIGCPAEQTHNYAQPNRSAKYQEHVLSQTVRAHQGDQRDLPRRCCTTACRVLQHDFFRLYLARHSRTWDSRPNPQNSSSGHLTLGIVPFIRS